MTRIGILETGAPPQGLQPRFGDYPQMFRGLLGEGFQWRTYDVQAGGLPARVQDEDAYIVTGSSAGVYDGDAWIGQLLEFLRGARGRAKLVGICFGHQAMAQAFGGEVIKSPKGWGVGLHTYEVLAPEPWMDPAPSISVPASHQDQVTRPPPGATVLAASPFTPYGMLDYGPDAISLQLHPEFAPAYAEALIENRRGTRFSEAVADAAVASLHRPNDNARVGEWLKRFLATP
ncbi:MAG TPA: type 1 glutamine amidotransferase [Caulobacteraceae bacterium]